jgi:hypothetical protein
MKAYVPSRVLQIYKATPYLQALLQGAMDLPALAHVGPSGNFNVPVVSECGPSRVEMESAIAEITEKAGGAFTVSGSVWFTDHCSREEPDIVAITRDVARGG